MSPEADLPPRHEYSALLRVSSQTLRFAKRRQMRTVFPTKELRGEAVETYQAIEGGQQTLSNLAAYVTKIKGVED